MNIPKISVVMSVYNGEEYLSQAIESVLNQTFGDFEFIIINDASVDKTEKILASYKEKDSRVRITSNESNLGLTKSLNIGLSEAKGEYIARMDADDISLPCRFQDQYDFMEKNNDFVLIGGGAEIIDRKGILIREGNVPSNPNLVKFNLIFSKPPIFHSSIFFRKKEIRETGGYNESHKYSQDFELYLRLLENKYKIANLEKKLIKYRIHEKAITKIRSSSRQFYMDPLFGFITGNYIGMSKEDFENLDALRGGVNNLSFFVFLKILKTNKKLYNSFMAKEELTKEETGFVRAFYKKEKRNMMQIFIKRKFPKFYRLAKKLSNLHKIK